MKESTLLRMNHAIAELQREVRQLRKELNDLEDFVNIPAEDTSVPTAEEPITGLLSYEQEQALIAEEERLHELRMEERNDEHGLH